ncbi:hypothetical protein BGZ94_005967, partial [Podila epigama]
IFCVDLDQSMDEYFYDGNRPTSTRITRTRMLLKWFINQKAAWGAGHEFALMVLGEHAVW